MQSEELARQAKHKYEQGEYRPAAEAFEQAEGAYRAEGQPVLAAEMANNRSVALVQAGDAAAALAAVEGTPQVFEQAGDRLKQAMAWGNRAAALEGLGRLAEAEQAYVQSADLLKELGELELRAEVLKALSALQLRGGRQLEALASMQAGIEGLEQPSLLQRLLKKLLELPCRFFNLG
ncbi:MAG: hypothetical protein HYZ26_07240 [Chloroflexi bacterium]|nr:hypothetical protein [Chloroflexota bacterium]